MQIRKLLQCFRYHRFREFPLATYLRKNKLAEYFAAGNECLKNRENLVNTISEADYALSETLNRNFTINDLFLERKDLGMRCAKLLVKQVRHQYRFLNHIPHNGDLQMLDEFDVVNSCLKYLMSTDDVIVSDLKIPEAHTNVHISFIQTNIRVEPINCQSLVDFTDKFFDIIVKKLQIHQEDCKSCKSISDSSEHCNLCTLLNEKGLKNDETSPLLKDFGAFNLEQTPLNTNETVPTHFQDSESGQESDFDENVRFVEKTPTLQEDYSWERFRTIILNNFKHLKQYYEDNVDSLKKQSPIVIIYRNTHEDFRVIHCTSIPEARLKACSLENISKRTFPLVLITTTDYKSPNVKSRKRMIQKFNDSSSKVGEEKTPSVTGRLSPPGPGNESSEFYMLFYLDTGADTGSVGYNYHVIKHFTCTVESINGSLEPAILCNFNSAKITAEEIQVFDVDEHPNWNAIGLSVLKNYRIYLDIKNDRIEIGKHEDVEVEDSEESLQVVFKKDVQPSPFPLTNDL